MSQLRSSVIALALCFAGFTGYAEAQTRHAILIGVSDYPKLDGMNLKGPKNDVALMRKLLTANLGYERENITVVADYVDGTGPPTRGRILGELSSLVDRVRTTPGADEVFLYFSGHGSRQPAKPDDVSRRSLDGFDAIFLPRDVGQWDGAQRTVENAILGQEVRQVVEDLQLAGAFVWVVIDSCHAGYSLRSPSVRPRFVPADTLRIPPTDMTGTMAISGLPVTRGGPRGIAQERPWMSFSPEATRSGGWVAFFASRPHEQALELDFPAEETGASSETYGMFTLQLFRAVQSNPSASFNQIAQEILRTQGTKYPVTPVFAGSQLERPVSQSTSLFPLQWPVSRNLNGSLTIPAGALNDLGEGTILSLWQSAVAKTDAPPAGFAQVLRSELLQSIIEPISMNGLPKVPLEAAVGLTARVETPAVPLSLEIALPIPRMSETKEEQRARELLGRIALRKTRGRHDIQWVDPGARADFHAYLLSGKLWFAPASAWPDKPDLAQGPSIPLSGLSEREVDLALSRLYKTEKLSRFAQQQTSSRLKEQLVFELHRRACGGTSRRAQKISEFEVPALAEGDCLDIALKNVSEWDVCITVLYLDSRYRLSLLWPSRAGETNLLSRQSRTVVEDLEINTESVGRENILLIAAGLDKGQDCRTSGYDFGFLAEPQSERQMRGAPTKDFVTFAKRFSEATRAGKRRDESYTAPLLVRFHPLEILRKDQAEVTPN